MRRTILLALVACVAAMALLLPGTSTAAGPAANTVNTADDTYDVTPRLNSQDLPVLMGTGAVATRNATATSNGTKASAVSTSSTKTRQSGRSFLSHPAVVGETRNWVGLDDVAGTFYRKTYTLRGIGDHIEVWVASELNRTVNGVTASGTDFQAGDCRNGVRTQITDAQVQYLIEEFDTNILPKESEAFSIAPDRDGSHALLGAPFHPGGEGDNTVVLIDNVRDDNFYDLNNTQGHSYIAGFFSSQLNELFDRNIMSIDAFDWLHRTGATPPHEPVPGNNCTSAPARPFLYEGVFAHEYQHLLEGYEDGDETNWINEGLSDWAQTLTGYVNPATPITEVGFDSHVQCFLGWLGTQTPANPNPRGGGPENSLTLWEDQGPGEILCDYGAAYTLMEYLHGQYGTDFMTALHVGDANGLAGLQEALAGENSKVSAQEILHNWSLMVAVDGHIDDGSRIIGPYAERLFTTPTLDAMINWATPHAYDTAGAPPNGADYVQLRNAAGQPLSGGQIDSLSFQGSTTLPARPVAWTVDPNPPFSAPNDPALYSGAANNRDEAIVRQTTVPAGAGAVLTFDALWNQELGWDFLFTQISTDGGSTYSSLTCTDTTTTTNPDALPTAKENVPGFTGYSGGWKPQTCSLAAYAGKTVLLAFRTFNDPAALGESAAVPPGAWVDDVKVGTTTISDGSTLAGWQSFTEVRPFTVAGFTVTILSIDTSKGKITVKRLPLTSDFALSGKANVQKYIDKKADFVGAIVFYDDPTETSTQYAPYRLTVNGVTQPGGGL